MAMDRKKLESLFYPIKINTLSHKQDNFRDVLNVKHDDQDSVNFEADPVLKDLLPIAENVELKADLNSKDVLPVKYDDQENVELKADLNSKDVLPVKYDDQENVEFKADLNSKDVLPVKYNDQENVEFKADLNSKDVLPVKYNDQENVEFKADLNSKDVLPVKYDDQGNVELKADLNSKDVLPVKYDDQENVELKADLNSKDVLPVKYDDQENVELKADLNSKDVLPVKYDDQENVELKADLNSKDVLPVKYDDQENVEFIADLNSKDVLPVKHNDQENVNFKADLNSSNILALTASEQEEWARESEDKSVANDIGKRVSLLCMVMTFPDNHFTKAIHVKETWGKRCDKLVFISTEQEPRLPTVKIPVESTRYNLWKKHQLAFQYIFDHHLQEAEWFMKADDDTYVIVENVKYLLNDYNTNDPVYFGGKVKTETYDKIYFHGGAGYVLSREAVRILVSAGSRSKFCRITPSEDDDVLLADCLNGLGAISMDTRDENQQNRFFMSTPEGHMVYIKYQYAWYHARACDPKLTGRHCCSNYTISFHQIDNYTMYILEYFVYHLRPYGISYEYQQIYN